jgi:CheY-like chemotaxis protein
VQFKSAVGQGTRFEVFLPARPDAAAPADEAVAAAPPRGQGETILFVDDEGSIRAVASRILERHGYKVLVVADGVEALTVFMQNRPAIAAVVTDMMMPGMDGPALVGVLRRLAPGLAIMGISGVGEAVGRRQLESLSLPVVLAKPFTADRLVRELHALLHPAAGAPPAAVAPPACA